MKIVILEDRGIYKKGQEVDLTYPHARQWVISGFAEYVDKGMKRELPKKVEPEKEVSQYAELKVSQLDALLDSRDLSKKGVKGDKVARLEENDAKEE